MPTDSDRAQIRELSLANSSQGRELFELRNQKMQVNSRLEETQRALEAKRKEVDDLRATFNQLVPPPSSSLFRWRESHVSMFLVSFISDACGSGRVWPRAWGRSRQPAGTSTQRRPQCSAQCRAS
jgi:hypothetical protein